MIQVAIVKRRLRVGKTYEDFRKAWYHTVGFGTGNRMFTLLNVADPREVIVIGLNETSIEQVRKLIALDASEREANPLDEVIEPEVSRTFGILVAEDDFSAVGELQYLPASVNGQPTDMAEVEANLKKGAELLAELAAQGKA
ncbi:MAG TPA: hypothetical protein VEH29_08120 [Acidimicrobiales bacterium]|nr:hypothetical protein [Acidimicrobiales bacterium]